jgi:hypothetical protein
MKIKNMLVGSVILLMLIVGISVYHNASVWAQGTTRAQPTLYGGIGKGPDVDRGEVITISQTDAQGTLVGAGASDPVVGITGLAFDTSGQLFAATINAPVVSPGPVLSTLIRLNPIRGRRTL